VLFTIHQLDYAFLVRKHIDMYAYRLGYDVFEARSYINPGVDAVYSRIGYPHGILQYITAAFAGI
jgi:hypothetical protein